MRRMRDLVCTRIFSLAFFPLHDPCSSPSPPARSQKAHCKLVPLRRAREGGSADVRRRAERFTRRRFLRAVRAFSYGRIRASTNTCLATSSTSTKARPPRSHRRAARRHLRLLGCAAKEEAPWLAARGLSVQERHHVAPCRCEQTRSELRETNAERASRRHRRRARAASAVAQRVPCRGWVVPGPQTCI